MKTPEQIAETLVQTFTRILHESMQDVPILNNRLEVQAVDFQEYQGRVIGIIITPWLMNLVMLPREGEDWESKNLGYKELHEFPSRSYKFMVNEVEGIGYCQTYSLFSPMNKFRSQQQAVNQAHNFMLELLQERELTAEEQVDEELLGKIMRGEETPEINLDDFETITPYEKQIPVVDVTKVKVPEKRKFDRRALLRGNFSNKG